MLCLLMIGEVFHRLVIHGEQHAVEKSKLLVELGMGGGGIDHNVRDIDKHPLHGHVGLVQIY